MLSDHTVKLLREEFTTCLADFKMAQTAALKAGMAAAGAKARFDEAGQRLQSLKADLDQLGIDPAATADGVALKMVA